MTIVTLDTPTESAPPVYGLVLAGGRSRRMGRDKATLEIGGETQLARAVALLERHLPRVYVSVRADQRADPARAGYALIEDREPDLGPVAGILAALETHADAAWLVLACDLPKVDDATVATLLANVDACQPVTAFRSSGDGLPEPLCAVWQPSSRALVREQLGRDVRCPRKMLIRAGVPLIEQPHPEALDNVNTPADLARVAGLSS